MKRLLKKIVFPGLDLHTRCRYRWLPKMFLPGPLETLDVGFGNGALSIAAYNKGNKVLGVSLDPMHIEKARRFFNVKDPERLKFQCMNAYNLEKLGRQFDQIICSEMLEHVREDQRMVRLFWNILKPGGVLHLCCPFALHPEHNLGRVDNPEDGGHVRDGYTFDSYNSLLGQHGFVIEKRLGLGSSSLVAMDRAVRLLRHRLGGAGALPLFLAALPFSLLLDHLNPKVPFSVYVLARKPSASETT